MIFTSASALGYDENITLIGITAEKGEVIRVGDTITIPMNDHTFEQREIIDMYRDWKKWAECVIHNIPAGRIHTINSPYDEEILEHLEDWVCS